MKSFLVSGLVDQNYRIKVSLLAISPDHAIKVFKLIYPKAEDIYVILNFLQMILMGDLHFLMDIVWIYFQKLKIQPIFLETRINLLPTNPIL